ncbi:hypothetical protein M514_02993, partial [Trichuris suis]
MKTISLLLFILLAANIAHGRSHAKSRKRESKNADSAPVGDVCSLPVEGGLCKEASGKWYFDSEKAVCVMLIFGGCEEGGFDSEKDCQKRCANGAKAKARKPVQQSKDRRPNEPVIAGITWTVLG